MENLSLKPSTLYETGRTLRLRRLQATVSGSIPNPESEAAQILEEVENQPVTGTQIMRRAQYIAETTM